ncbi:MULTISPECIES: transposase [unclassified Clostridioides]|uniref:transposase n=1 Tax=unclassified Clostridioides TaxID=2635829 RepID=UPI001D200B16|nr:transposase [Clostridioides sp. ES-S-0001-02]MCC0641334.1 transposase [Clostridioides sp. ES-S-0049-03]MCC0653891.1 transposase [Clostridioides sp. ES-S-0001-03]MCC0658122.1 transposase [Clostridioides sp. ES-S-0123-01]MCC0670903.1 transposase [Clostridioides sp. ES-S-0145-01]MCC0677550.1 transposase [Clostridioides sp. ES-W-0018-02]MCC0682054.1 transposase [Clostridioides sp. ES-S-0005-03]MCC0696658.1 transposase [Clostridioides sp. ES-S-0048-02]MCC0704273.1 transposase [Clostridioides 
MFNKNKILKKLIEEYDVKTTTDVQDMLKDLFASTIHQMLEAELDEHLGYDRYDNKNKNTKTLEMDIEIKMLNQILEK